VLFLFAFYNILSTVITAKTLRIGLVPIGYLLVSLAAIGAIYWQTLNGQFVWDDLYLFVYQADLRLGNISWAAVSRPILPDTTYFRPLVLLSFAIEFRLSELSPKVAHLVNLCALLANCSLLFFWSRGVFSNLGFAHVARRAFLSTLLYGCHPALIESTAWVSGRFDLFVTFFCLAALLAEISIKNRAKRVFVVSIFFAFALLSKEMAVVLPIVLVLQRAALQHATDITFQRSLYIAIKDYRLQLLLLALLFFAYLALRTSAVHGLIHINLGLATDVKDFASHAALVLQTFAFYAKMAIIPFGYISPLHPLTTAEVLYPENLAIAMGSAALIGFAIFTALRGTLGGIFLLCFFICLLPVVHIIPLTIGRNYGCERFLTFPLVFLALAVGGLNFPAVRQSLSLKPKYAVGALLGIWLASASATTFSTIGFWHSDFSLWAWTHVKHPEFAQARSAYIAAAIRIRRYDLLKPEFDALLAKGPMQSDDQLYYADYLIHTGGIDEGLKYAEGALSVYPKLHEITDPVEYKKYNNGSTRLILAYGYSVSAEGYVLSGDYDKALDAVDIGLWYQPDTPPLLFHKSLILALADRADESRELFGRAASLAAEQDRTLATATRIAFLRSICATGRKLRICKDLSPN
jgi:protein O-mannosyl-transferase